MSQLQVCAMMERMLSARPRATTQSARRLSTNVHSDRLRRCMLYVPGSFDRAKLLKTLQSSKADSIAFDLEDSVSISQKPFARQNVFDFLSTQDAINVIRTEKLIRINATTTEFCQADLEVLRAPAVDGILIPKVNSAEDIHFVESAMDKAKSNAGIIASIESAKAIMNLKEIATSSKRIRALLFAAEDYCADVGLQRSKSRLEMLYARSAVVTAAKAFGIQAIDLVCINLRDTENLKAEAEEGRRLGFNAKQAIHPAQVDLIQSIYGPSQADIDRALEIIRQDEAMQQSGKGAFAFKEADGSETMVDAPILLQVHALIKIAKRAGLHE